MKLQLSMRKAELRIPQAAPGTGLGGGSPKLVGWQDALSKAAQARTHSLTLTRHFTFQ